MFFRTFNPGPSQVSDEVKEDIATAVKQNIIAVSHRSSVFTGIAKDAVHGLKQYFNVPDDYFVILTSSATEAIEMAVKNLVKKESFHFTNGNFSELSARISMSYGKNTVTDSVPWGDINDFGRADIPDSCEAVFLNYNETSTGATCDNEAVAILKEKAGDKLLCVDVTSAAGCVKLNIKDADVWIFSVQKGIGLPSGLGIIFISPKALEQSRKQKHHGLYTFDTLANRMKSEYQTMHTPNVLGIYLLAEQMKRWNSQEKNKNENDTVKKAGAIGDFINSTSELSYFVKKDAARSKTTICIEAEPDLIVKLHEQAKAADIVLGSGYGKIKENTFRIANFPAITMDDMKLLIKVLGSAL
jgi:phosphoserine aminotransferase